MQTLRGVWKAIKREGPILIAFGGVVLSLVWFFFRWFLRGRGIIRMIKEGNFGREQIANAILFVADWGGWIIFGLSFVVLAYLLWRLCYTWAQNAKGLQAEFTPIFDSYAEARGELWNILDDAFATQRGVTIGSVSVRELMEKFDFPDDILKIPKNGSLYNYARKAAEDWKDNRKEFLEFCLMLFQRGDSAILNAREYKNLDGLRRALAKFWNIWEIKCDDQGMSISDFLKPDLIQGQTPDVVMLTYLEIAREIARGLHWKENS
jgi:hypothetical protein